MTTNDLDAILAHLDSLYRIAFCMLGEREAAEGCVERACSEMYMLLPGLSPESNLRLETFRCLFGEIQKRAGKWRWLRRRPAPANEVTIDAVRKLPLDQRASVLLCDVEDFSTKEASRILRMDALSMVATLNAGRQDLRHSLAFATSPQDAMERAIV
jgi:DNA-directed RNA polymerase specialized sigma24 family protein